MKKEYIEICKEVAQEATSKNFEEFLTWLDEEVLEVKYIVDNNLQYEGCILTISLGGPNIFLDTYTQEVRLFWGADYANYSIFKDELSTIDEVMEEVYISR